MDGMALNMTFTSHEDTIDFGVLGCRSVVPDIDKLTGYLGDSFSELMVCVARKKKVVFKMFKTPKADLKIASNAVK